MRRIPEGQSYRFLLQKSFNSGRFPSAGLRIRPAAITPSEEATDVRSDADSSYSQYHKRSQIQGNVTQQLAPGARSILTSRSRTGMMKVSVR